MAKYLVTGCAGFIGFRVTELLLQEGHRVVGVDNLNHAYDCRLKQWRRSRIDGRDGFSFHQLDITDRGRLSRMWEEMGSPPFDAVINLAARAGVRDSVENPWEYLETNATGALNLLDLCRSYGVGKFVQASSSNVYGQGSLPSREDAVTDECVSPYAVSKKAAELLCRSYHSLYGIDVTALRFFTVYGPAGRPDMMLFRCVQWISEDRPVLIYGDGSQSRDFTYVDDVARGVIGALKPLGCQIVNLGSDKPVVLNEAIRMIEELVGKKARRESRPPHPADVENSWADIGKARMLLGWEPGLSLHQGLSRMVDWYRQNRSWAREVITA